jgi:hypothetical protein
MASKIIADAGGLGQQGVIVLLGPDQAMLDTFTSAAGKYHKIVVFNPLERIDQSDERIRQVDADDFSWLEHYHKDIINGSFLVFRHVPTVARAPGQFESWVADMEEYKRLMRSNIGTVVSLGKEFMQAYLANVPEIVNNRGVTSLAGAFADRPAVVISAGPSLSQCAEELRALKGRALLVAVDAALPFLTDQSIVPDIVVGIDPLAENERFFATSMRAQCGYLNRIALVCLAQYTPNVVRQHPGPKFIADMPSTILSGWLSPYWQGKGYLSAFGGSVSHVAFGLAEHLGCDPICLVGQDLSFKDWNFYAPKILDALHPGMEWDARGGALMVKNADGEDVFTTENLLGFRASFEFHFRLCRANIYNATHGGLAIKGAYPIKLTNFGALYGEEREENYFEKRLGELAHAGPAPECDKDAICAELLGAYNTLCQIERKTQYLEKQTRRLGKCPEKYRATDKFKHLVAHVSKETPSIAHPVLLLVAYYHYQLELFLTNAKNIGVDFIEDRTERLTRSIERNVQFFAELREAINLLIPHLHKLEKVLRG